MHAPFSTDCDNFLLPLAAPDTLIVSNEVAIFGAQSELHTHQQVATEALYPRWSASYTYHGVILVLFALSLFTLPRLLLAFNQFYRLIVGQHSVEKFYEERSRSLRFTLRVNTLLNLLLWGCILVRTGDYFELYQHLPLSNPIYYQLLVVGAILGIALLCCYRNLLLSSVCSLIENRPFYLHYRALRRVLLGVGTLVIAPTFLLVSLYHGAWSWVLLLLLSIEILTLGATLLIKSAHFFLDRELSILQWFLYLCAVEIFPISLILLLLLRSGA